MKSLKEQDVEAELTARRAQLQRLELEVAEERAAIALLEQTQAREWCLSGREARFESLTLHYRHTAKPSRHSPPGTPRSDLGLLRRPGKVFLSKDRVACDARFDDFNEYEKPYWPLLAVSRSIRQEAAKVLFEQNQFIWSHFTSGFETLIHKNYYPRFPERNAIRLLAFAHKHLRSVSLTFDLRSPISQNPLMNAAYMRANSSSTAAPWSHLSGTGRRSLAHDYMCDDAYAEAEILLDSVLDCQDLTNLELDFTNCYCPMGCCRALDDVLEVFVRGGLATPAHLRVMGMKNQLEGDTVIRSLGRYYSAERSKTTVVFEKLAASPEMQDPFMGRSPFWCHLTDEGLDVELGRAEVKVEKLQEPYDDEE